MSSTQVCSNHLDGMTDVELELACEPKNTGASAPWVHWTSEIYSLGKCLRSWTGYPSFLPLFAYADHGVALHTHLFPHELENPSKVHFTWHPEKAEKYQNLTGKEVVQIVHPWVSYRRRQGIERSTTPTGTLVFFTHGTPSVELHWPNINEYIESLTSLPEKFQPIVLCLHMHDIKAGLHLELRRFGLPIVTVGNTLSRNFVDDFYDLIKDFSYTTTQKFGSPVAYCVELGIPFFYMGDMPDAINISDKNLASGRINKYWDSSHEAYVKVADALFESPVDEVTDEQREFIEGMLGFGSKLTNKQVRWILWRETFRNWWWFISNVKFWGSIIINLIATMLRKVGLLPMIKRIRRHLKLK